MLVPVIILLILSAINVKGTIVQKFENERLNIDLRGCGMVEKQCSHFEDDLALLSCALGTAHNNKTQLLFQCQHRIWLQQAEILDIAFLDYRLKEYCQGEPIIYCLNSGENALDCILKKKSSIREKTCWKMVNKIETLIFNDWQIVGDFLKHCLEDIQIHTCGRIPPDPNSLSQTQTLKCLENRGQNLRSECLFQINLLKDMKYSSLQTDKIIFAACSLEQTKYCPEEEPESLLLYKCLVRHKNENGMSKRCLDQMFYDQRNMVMNYRMSKGLVKSCKDDIKKYHCRKGVVDDKDVRLAQILLCLENISRNESTKLSPECISEMVEHRKMLMDDFRLSPELMQNCANDITMLCKKVETGGKTIHCLMEHARPRRKKEKRISVACQKSLETLVLETDPGEDWRVDPILRKACKPVVDRACKDINGGNGRVMSCLTEKLGSNLMTEDCETALMQIQYFISRDFKLDPQLYKACKYDAVTQCKAKLQWSDINEHPSEKDPLILPCLYNYAYNSEMKGILRPACEQQVKRVMRQRAVSVDLLPEIEDYCIDDLANLCFENTGKGEEISCLQKNMKDLAPKCREAVLNFTETQSGHIDLNPVVYINCKLPMEKLCANELKNKKNDDNVMDCLISHKSDAEIKVNVKCRAAIEHEQLISLKDYRFTKKFKNACKSYVVRFCPKAQTKSQVVTCLSEIVRNDTITRKKHTIFKDCRQQLRSQLFLQRDNSELDPDLKEACKKDLQIYCPNVAHVELAALECLQTAHGLLSNECNHYLTKSCNDMIEFYCPNIASTQTLECLKVHHQNPDFDDNCKIIIANRIKEQTTDESKNNLQNACTADIKKFCSNVAVSEYMPMEGKVVQCLKEKFRQSMLSSKCENELANVLKDQALNYRLDPLLAKLCKAEIHTICAVSNGQSLLKSAGQVEECLKNALLNHKIVTGECAREVVQIIEETEVDIEADPLLERACAVDLLKFCKDLEHGAGRRLKCLKIILNDEEGSRKLEPECEKQLSSRLEMYRYVASANELKGLGDVYQELSSSPSEKYFLVVAISIVGLIFIFGLYCGRITKKAMYIKRK